eukprot:scaffold13555_cov57-Phaeocystis_antarctica.AAC.4
MLMLMHVRMHSEYAVTLPWGRNWLAAPAPPFGQKICSAADLRRYYCARAWLGPRTDSSIVRSSRSTKEMQLHPQGGGGGVCMGVGMVLSLIHI